MIVFDMTPAQMKAGLTPKSKPPTLKSHTDLVAMRRRSLDRAEAGVTMAQQRLVDAAQALELAEAEMAEWVAANPEPVEPVRKAAKAAPAPEVDENQIEMFP